MSIVGENIRNIRKKLKISQVELSRLSGISQAGISDIEKGKKSRTPYTDTIKKIADALGCTIGDLMGESADLITSADLSPQERKLISDFRMLNQQGREYVLQTMAMAVQIYVGERAAVSRVAASGQ